ncbi:MAG: DUF86 domain-containing protein [Thermoanaerobaculia bacterium]|nr:DUF86 domain-containing protein [Thermoanaerobaculia bacterium]
MPDDTLLGKSETIERCVKRVEEVYAGTPANLFDDLTKQDSILLNLQRACKATIGSAMHLVRTKRLGVPQESRQAFELLMEADLLGEALGERMIRMVGFRNIAIHEYRKLDLEIVRQIVEERLSDLRDFAGWVIRRAMENYTA